MQRCGWRCLPTWEAVCWLSSTACACCASEAPIRHGRARAAFAFFKGERLWAYLTCCWVVTREETATAATTAAAIITAAIRKITMAGGMAAEHRAVLAMGRLQDAAMVELQSEMWAPSLVQTARHKMPMAHASVSNAAPRCSPPSARNVAPRCRAAASSAGSVAKRVAKRGPPPKFA